MSQARNPNSKKKKKIVKKQNDSEPKDDEELIETDAISGGIRTRTCRLAKPSIYRSIGVYRQVIFFGTSKSGVQNIAITNQSQFSCFKNCVH